MFSQQQQTHVFMEEQQSYWKSAEWRGLKLLINAKWWRSRVIARKPPLFNSRKYKINSRYVHTKRSKNFELVCPTVQGLIRANKFLPSSSWFHTKSVLYGFYFGFKKDNITICFWLLLSSDVNWESSRNFKN